MLSIRLQREKGDDNYEFTRGESWQPRISESQLEQAFRKFGEVTKVTIARETQELVAFIHMASFVQAYHAFQTLNQAHFGKIQLKV